LNAIGDNTLSIIPKEDEKLLLELLDEKKIPKDLIFELVNKAIDIRYQDKVIGLKDEISDLIKEYANKANG
jgi:hypothetical protein